MIGIAGENLVRFACVNADWSRNAGRAGMGAIMGSKNLKAIVVRGNKDLPVHDLPALVAEAEKAYAYMRSHKYFKMWQREGLMMVMEYANAAGILPTHNFKDGTFPRVGKINGETMLGGYKIGDTACFACADELRQHLPGEAGQVRRHRHRRPGIRVVRDARLEPRASTTSPPCCTPTSCATSWAWTPSRPAASSAR